MNKKKKGKKKWLNNILAINNAQQHQCNNILHEMGIITSVPYTMHNNICAISIAHNTCATNIMYQLVQ